MLSPRMTYRPGEPGRGRAEQGECEIKGQAELRGARNGGTPSSRHFDMHWARDGVVLRKPDRYGSPRGTAIPHPYQGFPWLQVFTGVRRSPFGIVKARVFHRCYVARRRRDPAWTGGTRGVGEGGLLEIRPPTVGARSQPGTHISCRNPKVLVCSLVVV